MGIFRSTEDWPERWQDADDPRVHYRISERASRISIKVLNAERRVEVVVPRSGRDGRRAVKEAQAFARKSRAWIDKQLDVLPEPMPFAPGAQILVRGELYGLGNPPTNTKSGRARPKIDHVGRRVIVPAPAGAFEGRVSRFLKREAREALTDATDHYAAMIDRRVAKVSVRDTASRWGSSVTRGDQTHISYSWRLICAPPHVLDYVCAHEVAHILEPHHGPEFWELCADLYEGDVGEAKHWLKREGARLHAVGKAA